MISKFEDFNLELHDYISGRLKLVPIMNVLMNDHSKEWYSLIGKYFLEQYGAENLQQHKILLDRIKTGNHRDKDTSYRMLGIYFITSYLDENSLIEMFGKPLYHSEFGEGFEPNRKYEHCSYFLNIDGYKAHIGYDHRGTRIEVQDGLSPDEVFKMIKGLVDKYVLAD